MKKLFALALAAVVAGTALAGCGSERQMAREVRQARVEAYRQWESRKMAEDEQQPVNSGRLNLADSVKLAQQRAYDVARGIHFDGAQYRRDIGFRAVK